MANAPNLLAVDAKSFEEVTHRPGVVLLDWWAGWCGPCRAFAPVFEKTAAAHPEVTFGKIDTEAEQSLAAAFDIRSIPTLMALRDGVLLFSQPGALPATALEDLIRQAQALDMEKVKAEVEVQRAAAEKAGS